MIVLDEQLLGRNIEREIKLWYRGPVLFVTELRPGTVIRTKRSLACCESETGPRL